MTTATATRNTYNGWANYETWNVSLWIQNDEGLYNYAKNFTSYGEFAADMVSFNLSKKTPDGVMWNDPKIDHNEMNELFQDL